MAPYPKVFDIADIAIRAGAMALVISLMLHPSSDAIGAHDGKPATLEGD